MSSLAHTTSRKLRYLFLIGNSLEELPVLNLPELNLIYFMKNRVSSLANLTGSNLPVLRRLQGSHNQISGSLPSFNFPEL